MKRTLLLFLLLTAVLLTACGGASSAPAAAAEPTEAPTEAPAAAPTEAPAVPEETPVPLNVPPSFRGTWIALGDPQNTVVFGARSVTVDGTEYELNYSSPDQVRFPFADDRCDCSLRQGYLYVEQLSIRPDRFPGTWFYREGQGDPMDDFVGTWTLFEGNGPALDRTRVRTYTVTEELVLLVNGESFPLRPKLDPSGGASQWQLGTRDEKIQIFLSGYQAGTGGIYTGALDYGLYCRNAESVELNADNWRDYFEIRVAHRVSTSDEGDSLDTIIYLAPREGLRIVKIRDGAFSAVVSPSDYAMVRYSWTDGSLTFREMTDAERSAHLFWFQLWQNVPCSDVLGDCGIELVESPEDYVPVWGGVIVRFGTSLPFRDSAKNVGLTFQGPVIDGDGVLAPAATGFDVTVQSISGTLLLSD